MLSSVHFTASSVEYKSSNRNPNPPNSLEHQGHRPTSQTSHPGQTNLPLLLIRPDHPFPLYALLGVPVICISMTLVLTVNCKERGFNNISELLPRPLNAKKLYLVAI